MTLSFPTASAADWSDSKFAAEMTERQFNALKLRIESTGVADIPGLKRVIKPFKSAKLDESELRKWLISSWNTEHILSLSSTLLEAAAGAILQWTFPQAYYSCFSSTLAFFQVAGFMDSSHSSVTRRFAQLVESGEYPAGISFLGHGTKSNMVFKSLNPGISSSSSLQFDQSDPKSWDRHIRQFLRSTRELNLDKKKGDLKLKTKKGKTRTVFQEEHWEIASDKIGPTGLLCLLYRKRIKANYRDIDTFTESGLDPTEIFEALLTIVDVVSTANESFIASAMGIDWYQCTVVEYLGNVDSVQLGERMNVVESLI